MADDKPLLTHAVEDSPYSTKSRRAYTPALCRAPVGPKEQDNLNPTCPICKGILERAEEEEPQWYKDAVEAAKKKEAP